MAESSGSWWQYVKAAFHFRFVVKGLGALPLNYLALFAGALFMLLFGLGGHLNAALGCALLTGAYELVYLQLLSTHPRFQAFVRAEQTTHVVARAAHTAVELARQLSRAAGQRYQALCDTCTEIESLLNERQADTDTPWADALKTGGLSDLQLLFARLLRHQERLTAYLLQDEIRALPRQIGALETELAGNQLPERVKKTKQQTLDVLRRRQAQISAMVQSCELAGAELERLEQQLALMRDQAAAGGDVAGMVAQIDSAVEGITDTTTWLLDSERMVGDTDPATGEAVESVTA